MRERVAGSLAWLTAPAREPGRSQDVGFLVLRLTLGLMWFYNVAWKRAPDFGEEADNGLYYFTAYGSEHPVLPPWAWLVDNVLLPNITLFGYLVIAAETAAAVLLLTGLWVRLGALVGLGQSVAIALSVMYAPDEWPWAYWLMVAGHTALLLGASGRWGALDAARAEGRLPGRQALVWAGVATVVALPSLVLSLDDPLAARGPGFNDPDPSLSTGNYNLVGALVLLALAALLVLAARAGDPARTRTLGLAAAGLGALAALSLHAQLGFTDPLLGGTPSSAAAYLCLAVVGLVLARSWRTA